MWWRETRASLHGPLQHNNDCPFTVDSAASLLEFQLIFHGLLHPPPLQLPPSMQQRLKVMSKAWILRLDTLLPLCWLCGPVNVKQSFNPTPVVPEPTRNLQWLLAVSCKTTTRPGKFLVHVTNVAIKSFCDPGDQLLAGLNPLLWIQTDAMVAGPSVWGKRARLGEGGCSANDRHERPKLD